MDRRRPSIGAATGRRALTHGMMSEFGRVSRPSLLGELCRVEAQLCTSFGWASVHGSSPEGDMPSMATGSTFLQSGRVRGSLKCDSRLVSNRVIAQMRSPARVSTIIPTARSTADLGSRT